MVIEETKKKGKQLPALPEEIMEDILKRLPVKSLVRFSCTCKRWFSLIFSNSKFSEAHIDHAKRPSWKFPVLASWGSSINWTIDCDCRIATIRPKETLESYLCATKLLGSCNGILFVFVQGYGVSDHGSKEHALWNPYANSIKRIDGPKFFHYQYSISGLSYDRANDDYKAIIVLGERSSMPVPYVFSLRRNSWKKLSDRTIHTCAGCFGNIHGITLDNGICHWHIQTGHLGSSKVICFDPVVEQFKDVPLPDNSPMCRFAQLGVLDGCLSFIDTTAVWVMKEYGSWTKLYVFTQSPINMIQPVGYNSSKDELVVIATGNQYDLTGYVRIVDVKKGVVRKPCDERVRSIDNIALNVVPYTESLLCPWLSL